MFQRPPPKSIHIAYTINTSWQTLHHLPQSVLRWVKSDGNFRTVFNWNFDSFNSTNSSLPLSIYSWNRAIIKRKFSWIFCCSECVLKISRNLGLPRVEATKIFKEYLKPGRKKGIRSVNCFLRKISTKRITLKAEIRDALSRLKVQEAHAKKWGTFSRLFALRQPKNWLSSKKKRYLDINMWMITSNCWFIVLLGTSRARSFCFLTAAGAMFPKETRSRILLQCASENSVLTWQSAYKGCAHRKE